MSQRSQFSGIAYRFGKEVGKQKGGRSEDLILQHQVPRYRQSFAW